MHGSATRDGTGSVTDGVNVERTTHIATGNGTEGKGYVGQTAHDETGNVTDRTETARSGKRGGQDGKVW